MSERALLRVVVFVLVGGVVGFVYQRLVGCRSGACAITSSPYTATIYGAVMGYLASGGLAD